MERPMCHQTCLRAAHTVTNHSYPLFLLCGLRMFTILAHFAHNPRISYHKSLRRPSQPN